MPRRRPLGTRRRRLETYPYNSQTQQDEADDYDWYHDSSTQGTLLRQVLTTYVDQDTTDNQISMPTSIVTKDLSGTIVAETDLSYDADISSLHSSGANQLTSAPWAARGNLTSVRSYITGNSGSGTYLTDSFSHYDTGAIYQHTAPNSAVTTYGLNTTTGCAGSFVASIAEPISGLSTSATWNCAGVPASTTDENGNTTTLGYTYGATGVLPSTASFPDGGYTEIDYPSATVTEIQRKVDSSQTAVSYTVLDSLGEAVFSQTKSGTNCDTVQTVYDSNARAYERSQPYATNCASSIGGGSAFSSVAFDGLDRPTESVTGDGSASYIAYAGNQVEFTDPAYHYKLEQRDGLGRLSAVCEVISSGSSGCLGATGFLTAYTYNPLGNMTGVSQNGTQSRTFAFDELGRMTSESNPETGTISYTFDTSSNSACGTGGSTSSGDLILTKNGASEYTCLSYDALHRVTRKGMVTSSNNEVSSYTFDSGSGSYLLGRLASASSSDDIGTITSLGFSYDSMGRPASVTESPSGISSETTTYSYNLAGEAIQTGLPSSVTLDSAFDIEGRLASVKNDSTSLYYVTSRSFNSASQVTAQSFGYNGSTSKATVSIAYNNMSQPWHVTYTPSGSGTGVELKYNWGASVDGSGNVTSEDDNGTLRVLTDVSDSSYSTTYTYDSLNRIASATADSITSD